MSASLHVVAKPLTKEQKIDRYGELDRQIQLFAPVLAEHKELKAEIAGWFDSLPPDQPATAKGDLYTIQLAAKENERTITDQKQAFALLRKFVGSLDGAIALVSIPLGAAIDKFIPKPLHAKFLEQARTGTRSLKPVRNEP
jgi:hypothetical protein